MKLKNWQDPINEGITTRYHWTVQHVDNLKMGTNVDIGAYCYFNAKNGIVIEDDVKIGSHCSCYSVSTIDNKAGQVVIKKGSRIGSHSMIMPNVTIGENSIVGSFSFVNQDIPDNVMALGIPAKIARILK